MTYQPVITSVRMSDYGYWVIDVSVAPGQVVSVMIAQQGISPDEARELALASPLAPERSIPPWHT